MALIPKGTHRGHLVIWEQGPANTTCQRWSILDPETKQFWNYYLQLPSGNTVTQGATPTATDGDIFCSGHAWTEDGNLFVAGGTVYDPGLHAGSKLAYIWDPSQAADPNAGVGYGWYPQDPMAQLRYYPSVTRFGDDKFIVTGGFELADDYALGASMVPSTYEVFEVDPADPHNGRWHARGPSSADRIYPGPEESANGEFNFYPRIHLLEEATSAEPWMFFAGFAANTGRVLHDEQTLPIWQHTVGQHPTLAQSIYLTYNSSVLLPINLNVANPAFDRVMRFGGGLSGYFPFPAAPVDAVELCTPTSTAAVKDWQTTPPAMLKAREHCNAVLLPDDSILVVGGTSTQVGSGPFVLTAEYLKDGVWTETYNMASGRGYHSVAVLLPSGKILSAGGDGSTKDYQIYWPPYLFKSARPVITGPVTGGISNDVLELGMSTVYSVPYNLPADGYIEKVVLMRPGSITHHSDFEQRAIALDQVEGPAGAMAFLAPQSDRVAPTGYYMMFLVSSTGVPSVARWVKVK